MSPESLGLASGLSKGSVSVNVVVMDVILYYKSQEGKSSCGVLSLSNLTQFKSIESNP